MYDSKNMTELQLKIFATAKSVCAACNITIFYQLKVCLSFVFTDQNVL